YNAGRWVFPSPALSRGVSASTATLLSSTSNPLSHLPKLGVLLYATVKRSTPMMRRTPPWAGVMTPRFRLSVCLLGYMLSCGAATAADSPLEMVRSTTDQALTVLRDSSGGGNTPSPQQLETMWAIVVPRFDTQQLAQRALGANWQQLTAEQQQEF